MEDIDGFTYAQFLIKKYLAVETEKKRLNQEDKELGEIYRVKGANKIQPFLNFLKSYNVNYKIHINQVNNENIVLHLRCDRDNYLQFTVNLRNDNWNYKLESINDFVNNIDGKKTSTILETKDLYFFVETFINTLYKEFVCNKSHLINGIRYLFEPDFNGKSGGISFI